MIIGPFLGPVENAGETGVKILVALPFGPNCPYLKCELSKQTGSCPPPQTANVSKDDFRLYTFLFPDLQPGEEYSYHFLTHEDKELNLTGGLTYLDCKFRAPGQYSEDDSFILMSCHNPFETQKGSADEGWAMWELLAKQVESDSSIRLLVLGGDQLYNDDVEKSDLRSTEPELRNAFIKNYAKYWSEIHYRKVLARVPSLAMWDDHDITDGWGGRPDQFIGKGDQVKSEWQSFFKIAREAFLTYQASRNPQSFIAEEENVFTFKHEWGENKFVFLDLRSQKNIRSASALLSSRHEQQIKEEIAKPDNAANIFVVSPVVPFRCNFEGDRRLSLLSKYLFNLEKWLRDKPGWTKGFSVAGLASVLLGLVFLHADLFCHFIIAEMLAMIFLLLVFPKILVLIPDLPTLSDDIEDSLTADCNRPTFTRILEAMFFARKAGKNVVLMSGDIHVCGISEIVQRSGENIFTIPQIVASPMAYKPMPKAVEGFTTTTSEMSLLSGISENVFARNIFYISKRNFAQIFPGRLKKPQTQPPVLFHLEGHQLPLAMRTNFTE